MERLCRTTVVAWSLVVLILPLIIFNGVTCEDAGKNVSSSVSGFEDEFIDFLTKMDYKSGAAGVMIGKKLVFSKGFIIKDNSKLQGDPRKLWPVSRMSQTMTAAAVMTLVEQGRLTLDRPIFGKDGILYMVKPWFNSDGDKNEYVIDPRVYNITIDHLLRHTSGWDSETGPIYDPLLNQYYVSQQYVVPDIASQMDQKALFNVYHIMRYMIAQPLDFTPGTQVAYSNFNYAILGRVIEEATVILYQDYVKQNVLEPCGMWHTRLATRHYYDPNNNHSPKDINPTPRKSFAVFNNIDLSYIDSAMGWYSNVLDMLRFFRCLGDGKLLSQDALDIMLKRPDGIPHHHTHSWEAAGLRVSRTGAVWQEGGELLDDQLFYCTDFVAGKHNHGHTSEGRKCYAFILDGNHGERLKESLGHMAKNVDDWPQNDLFPSDLSDFTYDATDRFPVVRIGLSEHHLKEYANALKGQGLRIRWISAYNDGHNTNFIVIASKRESGETKKDTYLDSGLSEKRLLRRRIQLEKLGYSLYFLQGYISASHDDAYRYVAIFLKNKNRKRINAKTGNRASKKEYKSMFSKYSKRGFMPRVQSMTYKHKKMHVDFIFEKQLPDQDYKSYLDFGMQDLGDVVQTNAKNGRIISYLDVTDWHGKPKFSAIFKHTSAKSWLLKRELSKFELLVMVEKQRKEGLVPTMIVAYLNKVKTVRYVAVFRSMTV